MYKKKILFSLFMGAFTVFPIVAPVYATNISDENPAFGLLTAQIQNVKGYFQGLEVNNSAGATESSSSSSAEIDVPVCGDHTIHRRLVLGVSTKEVHYGDPDGDMPEGHSLLNRFDASYVFLNDRHDEDPENPVNNRALGLDFNDLAQLRHLSTNMNSFFDQIVVDDSTFKDMMWIDKLTSKEVAWGAEHLQEMKNLLKVGGQFIFAPITDQFSITKKKFKEHNEVYQDVENQIKSSSHQFITEYEMPETVPHSYLLMNTVAGMVSIYKKLKLIGTPETRPAIAKQMNLEWSRNLEGNDDEFLRFFINQTVNRSDIQNHILRNYLVPLNYRPLCESVFGAENIKVDYDVPLPFDSNYKKIQSVLFTLTKEAGTGGSMSSWE